jgi:hypothetical protein
VLMPFLLCSTFTCDSCFCLRAVGKQNDPSAMFKVYASPNLALSCVLYNRWWVYEIRVPLVFLD